MWNLKQNQWAFCILLNSERVLGIPKSPLTTFWEQGALIHYKVMEKNKFLKNKEKTPKYRCR